MAKRRRSGKKGQAGPKKSGSATRKAIREARKKGFSRAQIARIARRSPSTIEAIEKGEIKSPPAGLAGRIREGTKKKKK